VRSVRDESGARARLDDIIDSVARDIVSGTDLEEIVRSADWEVDVSGLAEAEKEALADADLESPKKGRAQLEREMLAAAARSMFEHIIAIHEDFDLPPVPETAGAGRPHG